MLRASATPARDGRALSLPLEKVRIGFRRVACGEYRFGIAGGIVMHRLITLAIVVVAAALGGPAQGDVLIGIAAPMTGATNAWFGEQVEHGAALAVADLNAAGGVLGHRVRLITVDDFCDPEQAVAAAKKLVSEGVFVVGHFCSHSSIPASAIYEAAGVLMMSPGSSNPRLTELGRANVFRFLHRDDALGVVAAKYIADRWPDKKIAILHDNTVFGKGVADLTKEQLNRLGLTEVIYKAYVPGKKDYAAEIDELQTADIGVVFVGGYIAEMALMARAAGDRGYPLQLVTGMSLATEEFGLIAGPAAEGALFLDVAEARRRPEAAAVVERFRASGFEPEGFTLTSYP
jgi:branched-chain amino acid transport system substrate-binding protein